MNAGEVLLRVIYFFLAILAVLVLIRLFQEPRTRYYEPHLGARVAIQLHVAKGGSPEPPSSFLNLK